MTLKEILRSFHDFAHGIFEYRIITNVDSVTFDFIGKDVDIIVSEIEAVKRFFKKNKLPARIGTDRDFRFFFVDDGGRLIVLDFKEADSLEDSIFLRLDCNSVLDKNARLFFAGRLATTFHKFIKYYKYGYFHSMSQIVKLVSDINELSPTEQNELNQALVAVGFTVEKIDFLQLLSDKYLALARNARNSREKKRYVFSGKLNWRNIFYNRTVFYRFLLGFLPFYRARFCLPRIALVGNDGSGKTTLSKALIADCHKLEPLWIVMRTTEPVMPFWKKYRKKFLLHAHHANSGISWLLAFVGEFFDWFDRYIKYKIGSAWSKSGLGISVFERYPTDRIRGEYRPGLNLYPLEKFFPMPDDLILLDLSPEISISRKFADGHTIEEMVEKRENYLKLFAEIKPSLIINVDQISFKELEQLVVKRILESGSRLQYKRMTSAVWKPNKDQRKLNSCKSRAGAKNSFK